VSIARIKIEARNRRNVFMEGCLLKSSPFEGDIIERRGGPQPYMEQASFHFTFERDKKQRCWKLNCPSGINHHGTHWLHSVRKVVEIYYR